METLDVAIKTDAENLYGQAFKFSYDYTKLTMNSTTFSFPWTGGTSGNCQPLAGLGTGEVGYYLVIDRALYLPSPLPYVSAQLLISPTTSLKTIVLLGGDGTDNNLIDIDHASCIGSVFGTTGSNCTGGPGANSDVNGDGKVDILDLTLMGGNFMRSTSPWSP